MWRSLLRGLRPNFCRTVVAPIIAIGFMALVACAQSPPAGGADGTAAGAAQFLMISDLHFDSMADPKLVNQLAAADPDRWQGILDGSDTNGVSRYGKDSNWPLLRSALRQMKKTLPAPAFVLLPGD